MRPAAAIAMVVAILTLSPGNVAAQAPRPPRFVSGALESLPRSDEIALALSGAPAPTARGAGVYVWADTGFVLARPSTNGYTCVVERFAGRSVFPTCYDADASRTFLPAVLFRERLQRGGKRGAEADSLVEEEFRARRLTTPVRGAIAYRFSPHMGFYGAGDKWLPVNPFVMVLAPYATSTALGYERAETSDLPIEMGMTQPGRAMAYAAFVVARRAR